MTDHQQDIIDALEKALADARTGRLEAFAFAGTGHGDHAIAFAFNGKKPGERSRLLNALAKAGEMVGRAEK